MVELASDGPIRLRGATAADQPMIRAMVRAARLNPFGLQWQNFLIAEQMAGEAPQVVGIGQLRPHGRGVVELASLVVVETQQGQGVGTRLVNALIARAGGRLYLMCETRLVAYYQRFGFVRLTQPAEMPPPLRRLYRIGSLLVQVMRWFTGETHQINILAHPGPTPAGTPVRPA